MSNQTSTSQKPRSSSNRTRKLWEEGKWPPVGHPWRAVALLPKEESEEMFQSAAWKAISQGLLQLRDRAVSVAMSSAPVGERDEARGVYNIINDLLDLPAHIAGFHREIAPQEELK